MKCKFVNKDIKESYTIELYYFLEIEIKSRGK